MEPWRNFEMASTIMIAIAAATNFPVVGLNKAFLMAASMKNLFGRLR
jgi:hypothetical protein